MRIWNLLLVLSALLGMVSAQAAEDIVDVLRRSQDMRLASLAPAAADSARARVVKASFDHLLLVLKPAVMVELRVITGPVVAETLHGHVVVANEIIADWPEPLRLFVLAHELGHSQMDHWRQMAQVYQKWIPGAVVPALTDPVAVPLGREASGLAHDQEYAADAYAARALRLLGRSEDDMQLVMNGLMMTSDTPTHPGTRKRIMALRAQLDSAE
jgi:beta-lactamase regulating signal transducer with metallopeptidase domain